MNNRLTNDSLIGMGAIFLLTVWSITLFTFALLSGADSAQGNLSGILANAPNALPWLIPFVLVYVTWRQQVLGGFLFLVFGVTTIFFYGTYQSLTALLILSAPSILLGALLMAEKVEENLRT